MPTHVYMYLRAADCTHPPADSEASVGSVVDCKLGLGLVKTYCRGLRSLAIGRTAANMRTLSVGIFAC